MEFLDVVNDSDEVIGKASIEDIYKKFLTHRIVHIFIFNDKGEMALHLRSKHKGFCPNHWSTPVGGHVQSGETYEQAALREFEEELGIKIKIELAFKDVYEDPNKPKKLLATFKTIYNGPFNINPKEVEKIDFFTIGQIQEMIDKGEKFHPELLFLLRKHYKIK